MRSIVNTNLSPVYNNQREQTIRVLPGIILLMVLSACSGGQNFSQFPGFDQHFKSYPPGKTLPTDEEVALLKKYQPRVFTAKQQAGPIDFYKDYIAHGTLYVDGRKPFKNPTAAVLNEHRDDPDAVFKYEGNYKRPGTAVVYARIDYEQTSHQGKNYKFTFLTYNLVFPVSGILQGLGKLQSFVLALAGNLNDWHQLDHYVNVSVALLNSKPVAMTLQQHNYQTTYMLNPESATETPKLSVDVALRSNELYPHNSEMRQYPAVSFLSEKNIEFLTNGNNKPMMAGYDVTHGEKEINYDLKTLPQTDAFYQFKGSLGKNRLLPGRSGPPGADYITLPGLMPRYVRLVTGYRTDSVETEIALFEKLFDRENFAIRPNAINAYKDRFFNLILNNDD